MNPENSGHAEQLDQPRFGIGPTARVDLENLHRGAIDAEQQDHPRLAPACEFERQKRRLDQQSVDQQGIIAGQRPSLLPDRVADQ